MLAKNYIVWIESGCTTIAKLVNEGDLRKVTMPMCIINSPVGENAGGKPVAPNDPTAVKIHYHTDMIPYVFAEMSNGIVEFSINPDTMKYTLLDANANLVKQYELIVSNLVQTPATSVIKEG